MGAVFVDWPLDAVYDARTVTDNRGHGILKLVIHNQLELLCKVEDQTNHQQEVVEVEVEEEVEVEVEIEEEEEEVKGKTMRV